MFLVQLLILVSLFAMVRACFSTRITCTISCFVLTALFFVSSYIISSTFFFGAFFFVGSVLLACSGFVWCNFSG